MTNLFDDLREQERVEKKATDRNAAKFIFRGSMATTVTYNNTEYEVGFVYQNREEEDKAYLYILKPQTFAIGSIFTWVDSNTVSHHYIVYDEEKSVKTVLYNKYLCFECNVQVDDAWGYMSGPRSTYINTQLRQSLYEVSLAKPVLIMGEDPYKIADILTIGGRGWRVIEKDNYSAPGLVYYSLEQYVVQKDSEFLAEDYFQPDYDEPDQVRPGQTLHIPTIDGYFESDPVVKATVTPDEITLVVPYDIDQLTIAYKTGDEVRTVTYKVVM